MGKHNLGDQWVAVLADGKNHMLKRVAFGEGPDIANCDGCVWAGNDNCYSNDMPCTTIDLGELDENDILHCPFCGGKMEVLDKFYAFDGFTVRCKVCSCGTDCYMTKDKALEAANRRV